MHVGILRFPVAKLLQLGTPIDRSYDEVSLLQNGCIYTYTRAGRAVCQGSCSRVNVVFVVTEFKGFRLFLSFRETKKENLFSSERKITEAMLGSS